MNILFITQVWPDRDENNMYSDLMEEFVENNHSVNVLAMNEKRNGMDTYLSVEKGCSVLRVRCGNIQKVNKYQKVINGSLAGILLYQQCHKYFGKKKIDLIILALSTTLIVPFVSLLKKKYHAKLYLLLKEFCPQDPVDLGAMKKYGIVWRVFRFLEKKMYTMSDYIGTMSEAGIEYVRSENPWVEATLEVCPNSQKPKFTNLFDGEKEAIRKGYKLPLDRKVFVFGGNLGVSQGINEMVACIKGLKNKKNVFFLIIGSGTEYIKVNEAFAGESENYLRIMPGISRENFDRLLCACDVGLLFLNPNYTVPNVPSRLISYLIAGLPVIAAIDRATDVGEIITEHQCGISLLNGDVDAFNEAVNFMLSDDCIEAMRENSRALLLEKYTTKGCYNVIASHFGEC